MTESGYIRWPVEVAEHIKARLNTEEYVQSHLKATINEVLVSYTATAEIVRPKPDHEYAAMPGIKKTFLFMPVRESVVLERKFSCWCSSCMRAGGPGEGLSLQAGSFTCEGCTSGLPWKETSVERTDASGVANSRARTLAYARQLAEQLERKFQQSNQPVWVAVQNRGEDDPDQYWIGKAISCKKHQVAGSVGRVRYDKDDLEVTVEWYNRDISGGDERRIFKRWMRDESTGSPGPEESTTYTFNSTQLRAIDVKMQPVQPVGGVPLEVVRQESRPIRAAAQAAGEAVRNILFIAHRQRAEPPEQLWEIPAGEDSAARA